VKIRANVTWAVGFALLLATLTAAPALAAPELGVELSRDPAPTSTPKTHSDERAVYLVTAKNTASPNPSTGDLLTCKNSVAQWRHVPSEADFVYRWLRNGVPIAAETARTYLVSPADEGQGVQCEVTGTNPNTVQEVAIGRTTSSTGSNVLPVVITAKGSGTLTSGSASVTAVTTPTGPPFQVGQTVTGTGIPAGTTILAVGAGTLGLSANATTSGAQALTAGAQPFAVGQTVSVRREGIDVFPAGTTILALNGQSLTLSSNAISSGEANISAASPTPISTSAVAASLPVLVAEPQPATPPPSPTVDPRQVESRPLVQNSAGADPFDAEKRLCKAPTNWTPGATFTYQWLRNGVPIPGATSSEYSPVEAEDKAALLQCEVFGKTATGTPPAGGVSVAISPTSSWAVTTQVSPSRQGVGVLGSTEPTNNNPPSIPSLEFSNTTSGSVQVDVELPGGAETYALRAVPKESVFAWSCTKAAPTSVDHASVTCIRNSALAPQQSYPPIEVVERPGHDAPDLLVTKATVSGGNSPGPASAEDTIGPLAPVIPFGFQAFKTEVLDSLGAEFNQAGGHPLSVGASLQFTEHVPSEAKPVGGAGLRAVNGLAREIRTEAPPGFVGNPLATPERCETMAEVTTLPSGCPAASVVGAITVETSEGTYNNLPLFEMQREYGTPAQFAFAVNNLHLAFSLTPELRPEDGYAISLIATPAPKNPELLVAKANLCGFGAVLGTSIKHAPELEVKRCRKASEPGAFERPFLTLPTKCNDPASSTTRILADSWEHPGSYAEAKYTLPSPEGCNALSFEPTLKARPTTNAADSPTGLEVDLKMPANEDPEGTATAQLKQAMVTLPEGLVVNPSGANGLDACSSAQIKLASNDPISCPDASKIGSVLVTTPILDHPLPGALYVASPRDNPFGSLLALYLVVDSPEDGLLIKLPGHVEPNPITGRLTTSFDQNPQAPVSDVQLQIRGGATAPLRTPATCGKYKTTSSLTPWSAPESGPPATPKDSWSISQGPGGGGCATRATSLPNAPAFEAGTASPIAAAYSPFVVKLRRDDGSQTFSAISIAPPPGLLGKLAGIPYCPDSAVAAAEAKSGKEEQANPSCPSASQVGTVVAGAGAGPSPYYASGKAYLTGPYKSAPLSLAIVTPAVAGPFDLGNVVVKTALNVDPETAKITAVSDPLPQILQGIPLDVRSVAISMDRPGFTLNPTSCDPMAVTGSLTSSLGQVAALSNRFQVGECTRLGFKPSLKINLKGSTKRAGHPALTATLTYPKGAYANIASASVALPHSEFLDQAHIKTICTRVQFAADACPAGAIYGRATAITPLLDAPLSGPVYLRSSSNPLPDLVVDLRGQIHVALVGRIDSVKGGIRTTFGSVPDAPVSKFTLEMQGGSKGLLVNSRDVCKTVNRAAAVFTAQNGRVEELKPRLQGQCKKPARKRHGHGRR
jgi:hypothetical protein